jgi:uncharacterized protein YjbJ (UPF0337 family)
MNWVEIEGNWAQLKPSAKQRWAKFTDDDVNHIAGIRDRLIGMLQEKYGVTKEEAQRQADDWLKTQDPAG